MADQWPHGGVPYYPGGYPNYDPNGPMHNPGQTIPYNGRDIPPGGWFQDAPRDAQWSAGTDPVIRTYTWESPIFDLHPEFRGMPVRPDNVQPIWRPGAHLYVLTEMALAAGGVLSSGLQVYAIEESHPFSAAEITAGRAITSGFIDVTANYIQAAGNTNNAGLTKMSPGATSPRYWRCKLRFDIMDTHADPSYLIWAGMY